MKKGVTLTVLIITTVVLVILVGTITTTVISMSSGLNYVEYEKKIDIIEKEIRKANIKGETYGELVTSLPSKYQETIEDIEAKYSIELDTYYLLDKDAYKEMNISKVNEEFFVNFEDGIVFSVKPFNKQGENIYTTQNF